MSTDEKTINDPNPLKIDKENNSSSTNYIKEKKTYINLYFCKLSTGIIFTYIFIICSISINLVNRILFYHYEFEFHIFLIFLQEFFDMFFYLIAFHISGVFKTVAGELSFQDFYKLKYQFLGYALFFLLKSLVNLLGYQIVKNIPMYVNFRKFVTVMSFIYKYFFKKKKISKINILVVILFTFGAILTGIDDISNDYIGILVVFAINILTVINLEISENFKKNNGVSNVKLLAYNSIILPPLLLIIMLPFGEYSNLIFYFKSEHDFSLFGLFLNLFLSMFIMLINNLSFFISNEKNNSLFTQLISDSRYIFITLLSYFILKTFSFTWKNVLGLIITTLGAIIITISTMYENIEFKKNQIKIEKKKFVELSNIEEIEPNNEDDKNTENTDFNINSDSKEETNDSDISNSFNNDNNINHTDKINKSNDDNFSINNNNLNNKEKEINKELIIENNETESETKNEISTNIKDNDIQNNNDNKISNESINVYDNNDSKKSNENNIQ